MKKPPPQPADPAPEPRADGSSSPAGTPDVSFDFDWNLGIHAAVAQHAATPTSRHAAIVACLAGNGFIPSERAGTYQLEEPGHDMSAAGRAIQELRARGVAVHVAIRVRSSLMHAHGGLSPAHRVQFTENAAELAQLLSDVVGHPGDPVWALQSLLQTAITHCETLQHPGIATVLTHAAEQLRSLTDTLQVIARHAHRLPSPTAPPAGTKRAAPHAPGRGR